MPPSAARRKQPLIGRDGSGTSLFVSALVAVCATAGCSHSSQAGVALPQVQRVSPNGGVLSPIQHVVVMVQENHSFDDFFATFPGADGATYGLMKTPSGDVQVPLKQAPLTSHSIDHQHQSFEIEYDHGKMDGFNLV